ncbi:MAG: hypothetical protein BSOLF_2456 [Candidatus Carbobacillus altaicus]|uniref:Uncharacterized protein n=1 Tax=Candidatus Carbonibacillus altaicus TaxID=2163959 RepID=A0A2R6XY36_9BACL|nr:MAG: hypothetical protein BSOLF_2456 [Candidatus Carbobacillus altaicus]
MGTFFNKRLSTNDLRRKTFSERFLRMRSKLSMYSFGRTADEQTD